jgi:hypothetical protein
LNHVKVEVKPFQGFVRYFVCPFVAVFALAFGIISVPLAGQFSLATSALLSLGYAWFFSAPLLLNGTRNLTHQHFQASSSKNQKSNLSYIRNRINRVLSLGNPNRYLTDYWGRNGLPVDCFSVLCWHVYSLILFYKKQVFTLLGYLLDPSKSYRCRSLMAKFKGIKCWK